MFRSGSLVSLALLGSMTGSLVNAAEEATDMRAALLSPEEAIAQLGAPYYEDRKLAVDSIAALSPEQQRTLIPTLIELIKDDEWLSTKFAARAITEIGDAGRRSNSELRTILYEALDASDTQTADAVGEAWVATSPENRRDFNSLLLSLFTRAVNDRDEETSQGLRQLVDLDGTAALQALVGMVETSSERSLPALLRAIVNIAPEESIGVEQLMNIAATNPAIAEVVQDQLAASKSSNQPPQIAVVSPIEVAEGLSIAIKLDISDTDDVPFALSTAIEQAPEYGSLDRIDDRTYHYTASRGQLGEDPFTLVARDGSDGSTIQRIAVNVVADREPPQVTKAFRSPKSDPQRVRVTFSEPVADSTSESSRWQVAQATVSDIQLAEDKRSATVILNGAPGEGELQLQVTGLQDRARQPNTSSVITATVTVVNWLPGLICHYFEGDAAVIENPEPGIDPTASSIAASMDLTPAQRDSNFSLLFSGGVRVESPGSYTFYTTSDDGSMLWVNQELVVDNGGSHGMREVSGTVELEAGHHGLIMHYFQGGGGKGLRVEWEGPGITRQVIPATVLVHQP